MKIGKGLIKVMLMLSAGLLLSGCGSGGSVWEEAKEISPVIDQTGADPFVCFENGTYYYTKTTGDDIRLWTGEELMTVAAAGEMIVYSPEGSLTDLWAPELWHLDGGWYIYFAACEPQDEIHRMYVLKNEGEDPLEGDWELLPLAGMDDKFAIDGTVMELSGKRYFIWSGWEGYENVAQNLYLAEMLSPTEVMEEKLLLSEPEFDWETVGRPLVNEGPEVIVEKDTVNLAYSASGSWTDAYCLGLLSMPVSGDPKDPAQWVKDEEPILYGTDAVYGPGHHCFTVSPDGSEPLIVYHAARWQGSGWERNIRFGYASFDESGKLHPTDPADGSSRISLPKACTPAKRLLTDKLPEQDGYVIDEQGVRGFSDTSKEFTFSWKNDKAKEAVLVLYIKGEEYFPGIVNTLLVTINGEEQAADLYGASDPQPIFVPVTLKAGENTVSVVSDMGGAELVLEDVLLFEVKQ